MNFPAVPSPRSIVAISVSTRSMSRVDSLIQLVIVRSACRLFRSPVRASRTKALASRDRQVRVVINGGVGQKFAQRAFAAVDSFGHSLELVAQDFEVGDEVVCARDDLFDVPCFRALSVPPSGTTCPAEVPRVISTYRSPSNPAVWIVNHRIAANDVLILCGRAASRLRPTGSGPVSVGIRTSVTLPIVTPSSVLRRRSSDRSRSENKR